ncbi:MAG: dihydrofolate reductase family protein [Cyclobacteriaceae bacterium]|nr:dihydrofolate reductase family protein [Cyclobacteriaceae bacterium]
MKKLKLYIAISLNGKIAKPDGSVDWLESIPNPEKDDYGYSEFYKSIDTTIQGYSTYDQIIQWGIDFPYADKKNYVLTRKQGLENTDDVEFITENHIETIQQLKEQEGKDIWLIGGGQVNTLLFNENLIDEIFVFVMPIVIPNGIDLFEGLPDENLLTLINTKTYDTGVVELKYAVTKGTK